MPFSALFESILPVFAVMLVGFLATASIRFRETLAASVNDFVFYIALPALLFQSVAKADLSAGVPATFFAANLICIGVIFAAGLLLSLTLFRNRLDTASAVGMVSSWGNVAYLGIPLITAIQGPEAAFPAAMGSLLHNLLNIALFLIFVNTARQREENLRDFRTLARTIVRRVVINPIFLSVAAGLVVAAFRVPVPQPVDRTLGLLAPVAAAGGLFTVGVMLRSALLAVRDGAMPLPEIGLSAIVKLAVMPMVAFTLVNFVFPMPSIWAAVTIAMSALPNAATVFVLTKEYKVYAQESAAAIVTTTALSLLTFPVAATLLLP